MLKHKNSSGKGGEMFEGHLRRHACSLHVWRRQIRAMVFKPWVGWGINKTLK